MQPVTAPGALFAVHALLPQGWARDVLLEWDAHGHLCTVQPHAAQPPQVPTAHGLVVPGLPNLHSHAFQRAFAGLTEYRGAGEDSFWSWRALMYRFAHAISPAQMEAIATWVYLEMLDAGYTHVCEFHYLHHRPDGQPYADDAEMAQAILRAAARTGIGLTLLPVLYQGSGFGGVPPEAGQRRFVRSVDSMLRLLERLQPLCAAQGARLGLAPHSLRAVAPDALQAVLAGLHHLDPAAPIHIHIAEQTGEVDACRAWSGQRPVDWLLDHAPVGPRWCLVHATHMEPAEARRAAATGAVAGLCPTTEANLGDGIFDAPAWCEAGGAWGIGSDSHVAVDGWGELRMLEYSQRLAIRRRNVFATRQQPETATRLLLAAVHGGAQAAGRTRAGLQVGAEADFIVVDTAVPLLQGLPPATALAARLFAQPAGTGTDATWCRGRRHLSAEQLPWRAEAARAFAAARRHLLEPA